MDLVIQRTGTEMVLNTSLGRKVPTIFFSTNFGNAGEGGKKDGINTCESFSLANHNEQEVTVIVVAYRLVTSSQAYSLVTTGLLRSKYHTWIFTPGVRDYMLALVSTSNDEGWNTFDILKRGKTAGLLLTDLGLVFPDLSEDLRIVMLSEADDTKNRRLDFNEFVVLLTELKSGALRSAEPTFNEEKAPPNFLQDMDEDLGEEQISSSLLLQPAKSLSLSFVILSACLLFGDSIQV